MVLHHEFCQQNGVVRYLVAGQCQGEAVVKRDTYFLYRGIEGDGGQSEDALHLLHHRPVAEVERMGEELVADALVV